MPDGDAQWQVAAKSAPPPANAAQVESGLGFVIADSGVLLIESLDTSEQQRLPAGEAMLTRNGARQVRTALGSGEATYQEVTLVAAGSAAAATETTFSSEPFASPGARHDLDLLLDALAPGAPMAIPAGAMPALILVLDGGVNVTTDAGEVVPLLAGEAASLSGALSLTATEAGADVAAVYTGPAVPRLGEAAATPRALQTAATPAAAPRVIEPPQGETIPVVAGTPAATAAAAAVPENADEDGDGLTAAQEAELNTDPALADTDEDGLTDGQEVEIGTAPLAPDTDGDGILDGDEVAQGTDPLTAGGAAAPAEAEAPATEPETASAETAATADDSDGDGLEDAIEFELGTDPADTDTDDDGLTDGDEYYIFATGTRNPDTDGDGVLDGDEVANGTDPNDPASA